MDTFRTIAIPLSRQPIVDFLLPPTPQPRGAPLQIVGQWPTRHTEAAWVARLRATPAPGIRDLLAIDNPHANLLDTTTDRLVPVHYLREDDDYLTRNLGGWAPIYFAMVGGPLSADDPLLAHADILATHASTIPYYGAAPELCASRLEEETGTASLPEVAGAISRIHTLRETNAPGPELIDCLYHEIASGERLETRSKPPVPELLLFEALLGEVLRYELARRGAQAAGQDDTAQRIGAWFDEQRGRLNLILKGEYIMGRHRRSTILIAPVLGVVIKHPAPEPQHDAAMGERTDPQGREENWPILKDDGLLQTARGRIRHTVEQGVVPRLYRIFGHRADYSTLTGLTVEDYVSGQTVQELVLDNPDKLDETLYERVVLHQQVCEQLGVDNPDWHSANFVLRFPGDDQFVHVDWGASRPLNPEEKTPTLAKKRLAQVRNIAYSFHDEQLAERAQALHDALVNDDKRMQAIRHRARDLIERG